MSRRFWKALLEQEPRPRRGVRIVRLVDESTPSKLTRYGATCGDCQWSYVAGLRVICEEAAAAHRRAHRDGLASVSS